MLKRFFLIVLSREGLDSNSVGRRLEGVGEGNCRVNCLKDGELGHQSERGDVVFEC